VKIERKAQKINDNPKTFEEELMEVFSRPLTIYPWQHGILPSPIEPTIYKEHFGNVKVFLVGGAVREIVRGFPEKVKDWDFAIEAESFEQMEKWVNYQGFEIFLKTPEYFTIRARASNPFYFAGMDMTGRTFDFTLCRTEGEYTDGRHPDSVNVGTIEDDLARRDFTMNAIAMNELKEFIDPFGGQKDIERKVIRLVGGVERLEEDSLRMLRAVRFAVQLGFRMDGELFEFLHDENNQILLDTVSDERVRDELHKAFKWDTRVTLETLNKFHWMIPYFFSSDQLWLEPTSKKKRIAKGLQNPTD
jgi:tRNA nucleotidyltransferase/poly(A) polymerase